VIPQERHDAMDDLLAAADAYAAHTGGITAERRAVLATATVREQRAKLRAVHRRDPHRPGRTNCGLPAAGSIIDPGPGVTCRRCNPAARQAAGDRMRWPCRRVKAAPVRPGVDRILTDLAEIRARIERGEITDYAGLRPSVASIRPGVLTWTCEDCGGRVTGGQPPRCIGCRLIQG
jgi:hypothetical protein